MTAPADPTLLPDLAAAPCGSRALDERIALALGWRRLEVGSYGLLWHNLVNEPQEVPFWSVSIDAALTLVPMLSSDTPYSWRVGNLPSGGGFATVGTSLREHEAATPALALCIAALKARGAA